MSARGVMAELTGRRGGLSKGKGGSMHMFSKEKHFYGGHGIVGAQVSLGTGLAFATGIGGNDNVSLAYFGDGAANQGQFYESFNMAALWKLPWIYIVENQPLCPWVPPCRGHRRRPISPSAALPSAFPAIRSTAWMSAPSRPLPTKAVEHCRSRQGPDHPRNADLPYRGHSMSDPAKYRSKDEVQKCVRSMIRSSR